MAIKKLKTLAETKVQSAPLFIAPLGDQEFQGTPEYLRALSYVKTIARVKNMLILTIKSLPKKSQDSFVKAIKRKERF